MIRKTATRSKVQLLDIPALQYVTQAHYTPAYPAVEKRCPLQLASHYIYFSLLSLALTPSSSSWSSTFNPTKPQTTTVAAPLHSLIVFLPANTHTDGDATCARSVAVAAA